MALAPISQISNPFEDYPGYWLKAYAQGTVTPITMATDSTGATTVAKAEISSGGTVPIGFIKTAGDAIFIPYVSVAYDLWLFPTESEADANDTTNAIQLANNMSFLTDFANAVGVISWEDDIADMAANLEYNIDNVVLTLSETEGDGGGRLYTIDGADAGNAVAMDNGLFANPIPEQLVIYTTQDIIRAGENAADSLLGTADGIIALGDSALKNYTNGVFTDENIAIGSNALEFNLTARDQCAIGFRAAQNVQDTNSFGGVLAIGNDALGKATDVYQSVAVGNQALAENVTGEFNHAFGWGALQKCILNQNTGLGLLALGQKANNDKGVAVGFFSGASADWTTGACFVGFNSGLNVGVSGTGIGSVNGGSTGATLVGNECGSAILSGDNVTGLGSGCLRTVAVDKTGNNTTAIGAQSGQTTLITASNCTLLGAQSDVKNDTDDGQVVITRGDGTIAFYDDGSGNTHLTASATRGGSYNIGGFNESFGFVTATNSFVISVAIPDNARIKGCQLRVDQALAGGDNWDAAYSGGATQTIGVALAEAVNTKQNAHFNVNSATDITSGVTDITITKNGGGNFTAQGLIRAFVYYQTFTNLDNV